MTAELPFARHVVTAVIVAHDGSRWLPDTLQAVRAQTRPVQRAVGADTGSRDRSGAMLAEALGADRVLTLPRQTGYGAAIEQVLSHPIAYRSTDVLDLLGERHVEWIWLLHDDSAPEPDALYHLLAEAENSRHATVIGPKLRDWHDRRVLLEVGITVDSAGRRETSLEPGEFDQGQHDDITEVLAVNSAGMLVRRDAWEGLRGFDPALPLFRDDIDFGWRANAAGYRVHVATRAVVYHAEASARRRRRIAAASDHPRRLDRRNALYVLLANLPRGAMWLALVRNFFGGLLRLFVFLLAKQPGNALDEVIAYLSVVSRPWRLRRARRWRAAGRKRHYRTIRALMPARWHVMGRFRDMVMGVLTGSGPVESAGRHHAVAELAKEGEEAPPDLDGGAWQRVLTEPGVLLFLLLAILAVVAERSLLGAGTLGGGALPPIRGGASDLWAEYFAGWHGVGLGSPDPAPPYVACIALLATLLFGSVPLAVGLLLLGCVPLAGATAYLAARRFFASRWTRVFVAASYALLPVAMGTIAAGRLGTAVAFVLLPVAALFAHRMVQLPQRTRRRRAAYGLALVLAVATAFVPLVWVLAVVLAVLFYLWRRGGIPGLGASLFIAVVVPPILLVPWTGHVVSNPILLLDEAGLSVGGLEDPVAGPLAVVLLQPGGPGMPPLPLTAGLVLAALAALRLPDRRTPQVVAWTLALTGLGAAVLVRRFGAELSVWPGLPMALAGAGVIAAAGYEIERLIGSRRAARGWRRKAATLVLVGLGSLTLLSGVAWARGETGMTLTRDNPEVLPAFVAASSEDAARARTLVLRPADHGIDYVVLRDREPLLGDYETNPPKMGSLDHVVASLASGSGTADSRDLAPYGIQYVLAPAPFDHQLLRTLDSVPGLSRISMTGDAALWRTTTPTSRLSLLSPDGSRERAIPSGEIGASAMVSPGDGGRMVALAETADPGWTATLDGTPLSPAVVHGWAQGFELPASGGRLIVEHESARRDWVLLEGFLLLLVIILALPGGQQEDDDSLQPRTRKGRGRRGARRASGHRARRVPPQSTPAPQESPPRRTAPSRGRAR